MNYSRLIFVSFFILLLDASTLAGNEKRKKNIADMTDAELEALYEQWEESDEPLEEDEKPSWQRKPSSGPGIDLSKLDMNNPESVLAASKKGKSIMMFVAVSGKPDPRELDHITGLWQQSLHNGHEEVTRYVIDDHRAIFMVQDGARAWPVKDFLIQQERCLSVTIEGRTYHGKGSPEFGKEPVAAGTDKKSRTDL